MRRILGFFWFLLIVAAVLGYSLYLDHAGIVTSGKVSDKHEAIFVHAGNWNRSLQMVVRFQVPGEPLPRYAQGNVDTSTYDRARIGDAMQVRYLPSPVLHQVVIIPSSRLASSSTFSLPSDSYAPLMRGIGVIVLLGLLLIIAAKSHSKIISILFLVLGSLAFGYFGFPRQMPAPIGKTESTRATVSHISVVTRILKGQGRRSRGMTISQPYDIVELRFTPRGRTEPVLGVDEIDHDSIPGLSPGDSLPIQYQLDQPRIVRLFEGQRSFPEKARLTFLLNSGAMFLFLSLVYGIRTLIRSKATRLLAKAQTAVMISQRGDAPGAQQHPGSK